MVILGIDPGLQVTGYGLIETNRRRVILINAGYIKTTINSGIQNRLDKIYAELKGLIDRHRPSVMVLEKLYAHYRHPTTACLLGHVRGIICLLAAQLNLELFEYSATRVKKSLVGSGHASKYQIQRMVQNLLNLKNTPSPEDIADALALAIAHTNMARGKI
jgi:crossover junction endodeoxyribonuclease RuvC